VPPPDPVVSAPHPHGLVLVVEDEHDIGKLWLNLLPHHGWQVLWARDAEEALQLHAQHGDKIGPAVLRHRAAGVDGWELCTRLRLQRPQLRLCSPADISNRGQSPGGARRARRLCRQALSTARRPRPDEPALRHAGTAAGRLGWVGNSAAAARLEFENPPCSFVLRRAGPVSM